MRIFLSEKASVGRAIANVLHGKRRSEDNFFWCDGDIVAWVAGHLLELYEPEDYDPTFKEWGLKTLLYVPEKWKLRAKKRTKPLFDDICRFIIHLDDVGGAIAFKKIRNKKGELVESLEYSDEDEIALDYKVIQEIFNVDFYYIYPKQEVFNKFLKSIIITQQENLHQ